MCDCVGQLHIRGVRQHIRYTHNYTHTPNDTSYLGGISVGLAYYSPIAHNANQIRV